MTRVKIDSDRWCRCGGCGHKLFRILNEESEIMIKNIDIEIKCHSCKSINVFNDEEDVSA